MKLIYSLEDKLFYIKTPLLHKVNLVLINNFKRITIQSFIK
jgi:hypothetical protein